MCALTSLTSFYQNGSRERGGEREREREREERERERERERG